MGQMKTILVLGLIFVFVLNYTGSKIFIDQNGNIAIMYLEDNGLSVQKGYNNFIFQSGTDINNYAWFFQSGYLNYAFLDQSDDYNKAHISQKGSNNQVVIKQAGNSDN